MSDLQNYEVKPKETIGYPTVSNKTNTYDNLTNNIENENNLDTLAVDYTEKDNDKINSNDYDTNYINKNDDIDHYKAVSDDKDSIKVDNDAKNNDTRDRDYFANNNNDIDRDIATQNGIYKIKDYNNFGKDKNDNIKNIIDLNVTEFTDIEVNVDSNAEKDSIEIDNITSFDIEQIQITEIESINIRKSENVDDQFKDDYDADNEHLFVTGKTFKVEYVEIVNKDENDFKTHSSHPEIDDHKTSHQIFNDIKDEKTNEDFVLKNDFNKLIKRGEDICPTKKFEVFIRPFEKKLECYHKTLEDIEKNFVLDEKFDWKNDKKHKYTKY